MSALLLGAMVFVAPGCGSDGASRRDGSRGGNAGTTEAREDATVRSLPSATRAFMENGLRQFSSADPKWEGTREQWLAMGERESSFLVALMWGALLKAQKLAAGDLVERARHELAKIGPASVSLMGEILAGGTAWSFYDDISEEEKVVPIDDTSRREAAEVLALVGPSATDTLSWVLDNAETKSGRKFALTALGNMGERGGPESTQAILNALQDSDWIMRVEAVQALRTRSDARSASALMRALDDEETLVREKAADALAARKESSALDALRSAFARARSAGRLGEAGRYNLAIRQIVNAKR